MNHQKRARILRPIIEKASTSLSDEDALEAVDLFARWDSAHGVYNVDDRVKYDGNLYRCLQMHNAQAAWTPTDAPSLWAKVLIPDENVIPEWEQPDSTNPYQVGDRVRYNGKIYENLIPNNVWAPDIYPSAWKEIQQ